MVLCKFFQQGSCRFGSKCVNEHFDVKQVIKADVEAAINGKQWPLSTYGPFKDKPSIPNFIEDQSFEEVRLLCYEAKQKNFFEQFHQQFNKEALEANNKMKALLQMTPEIIDIVINVYDTPTDLASGNVNAGKTSNPFNNTATTNPGSIFAKASTNTNNIFATSSGGGPFGTANQIQTNNIYGNSSVFGNQQQQQQQNSIFGQTAKPANSIFGGGVNNNQQNTSSIFGQQQSQSNPFTQPQQQQPQQTTGIFVQQNQQNTNVFRQAIQTNQQQPQIHGIFAQAAQTIPQQQGLFAHAAQQTPQSGQGLFVQAAQQTQNIFGQRQTTNPNLFQQIAAQPQQQTTNIFQQNQTTATQQNSNQPPPPTGLFQQAAHQTQPAAGHMLGQQFSSTVYSRLEDLTAEEIEAFKADCFLPGKIPFNPPPRELIH
ncbi:uncharacterized protein ACRADG_005486 [Cochliomyia hominivorax]